MAEISQNTDALIKHMQNAKNIAVVGLSADPSKASYQVASYLQNSGYHIIPVNPGLKGPVLGETPYPNLQSIPAGIKIDIIDVFRRPADVPAVVEQAKLRPAPLFWMQLGISNPDSARQLVDAGFDVVQNRCLKVEHARLL